jgi:hypothetical protein
MGYFGAFLDFITLSPGFVLSSGNGPENRPAFTDLAASLAVAGTELVLVERLNRLARLLTVQESILQDLKRKRFALVSRCNPPRGPGPLLRNRQNISPRGRRPPRTRYLLYQKWGLLADSFGVQFSADLDSEG